MYFHIHVIGRRTGHLEFSCRHGAGPLRVGLSENSEALMSRLDPHVFATTTIEICSWCGSAGAQAVIR
jgi:hypothetical protein